MCLSVYIQGQGLFLGEYSREGGGEGPSFHNLLFNLDKSIDYCPMMMNSYSLFPFISLIRRASQFFPLSSAAFFLSSLSCNLLGFATQHDIILCFLLSTLSFLIYYFFLSFFRGFGVLMAMINFDKHWEYQLAIILLVS